MIVFLDIDGVMNTGRSSRNNNGRSRPFDREAVAALNRVLIATGAKIIVSSAWRYFYKPHEFDDMLALEGLPRGRVAGYTPKPLANETDRRIATRGEQIYAWLEQNPGQTNYAVIDDDYGAEHMLDHSRVFIVDEEQGLTDAVADAVIARLRGEAGR